MRTASQRYDPIHRAPTFELKDIGARRLPMARDDISWVRTDAEGKKLIVYAHQVGDRWDFYCHAHRHDDWEVLEEPTLDDWREVLDAVRRRAQRNLYPPDAPAKLERALRRRFPGEEFQST